MRALAALAILTLTTAASAQTLAAGAPGSPYRVLVTGVDSSDFPKVKLEFKVIVQQAGTQPWRPEMGLKITERVDYREDIAAAAVTVSEKPALEPTKPDLCDIKPVAMGVNIDVSGSVGPLRNEIANGASQLFLTMKQESQALGVQDVGALYAFSSQSQQRFPLPQSLMASGAGQASGANGQNLVQWQGGGAAPGLGQAGGGELYTAGPGLDQLAQMAHQIPSGGGSPIWNAIRNEAELMSRHDPQNNQLQRVLVNLTDGQDNLSTEDDVNRLMFLAQQAGISLVNLGYGQANHFGLGTLAQQTGGVYVAGVSTNIDQILVAILDGMRKTYCIEYTSPHPNLVNEPAMVTLDTGKGAGAGVFPLPFVIPEDSPNVKLFVPVTEYAYRNLMAGQNAQSQLGSNASLLPGANAPVFLKATAKLVDAAGEAWAPRRTEDGREGPDRPVKELPFFTNEWSEGVKGEPLSGWGIYLWANKDDWVDLYKTPTDYVELHDDASRQVIDGVGHWVLEAQLEQAAGGQNSTAKRDLAVRIRLSVQDRTPPSIELRARPQDGAGAFEARVVPEAIDQDTGILPTTMGMDGTTASRPTYAMARTPGQANKRAQVRYTWRAAGNEPVEGVLPGQRWTLYDAEKNPTFRAPLPGRSDDMAVAGTEHRITEEGLRLNAGIRMAIRVAARDNFALAEESGLAADKDIFMGALTTEGLPLHADLDLSHDEAEAFAEAAPYLPTRKRAELAGLENRAQPGVSWWVESKDPRDQYHELEGVTSLQYKLPDHLLRQELQDQGLLLPHEPIRVLKVLAQDGQGNHTTFEVPIVVVPNGFHAETIEWRSERASDSVLD